MSSEAIWAPMSISIGALSLYLLLNALRQRLPTLFPSDRSNLHKVIETQALLGDAIARDARSSEGLLTSITSTETAKRRKGTLTLEKRLKYARWQICPITFRLFSLCLSGIFLSLSVPYFNFLIQGLAIVAGPIVMNIVLEICIERRSNTFDADYPQFLMSMVGLLKTGMTASGALETAARGLPPTSLVRHEVLLVLERIRVGVLEDKSIGAFGEDIYHPEIELFVQALLLSNRIGGNLSESLERLSKQVRKRQFFRTSAVSAVALQRSSLVVIVGILVLLQGYIGLTFPSLILDSLRTNIGWHVWQTCVALLVIAFLWARRVTQLKV